MTEVSGNPLVSVLIPCHNAERWIGATLESVYRQTWTNLEVVVVDDGSDDASGSVAKRFESKGLIFIQQPNAGAASARNRAFERSRGEYVQFLDADDLLEPEKIEIQLKRLVGDPGSVGTSEWARFDGNPAEALFSADATWRDMSPVDWLAASWGEGGGMMFPALWLVPRDVAIRAGPWNERLSLNDDGEYYSRVVLASRQVLFCPGARAYYRSGLRGSLSALKSVAGWTSQFQSIELCESHLLAAESSDRTRRACSVLWQSMAHACYPYDAKLANMALRRAQSLHSVRVRPGGGAVFRVVSRLLGWKVARILQRVSGRW